MLPHNRQISKINSVTHKHKIKIGIVSDLCDAFTGKSMLSPCNYCMYVHCKVQLQLTILQFDK